MPHGMKHKGISTGLKGAHMPGHTMGDMNQGYQKHGSNGSGMVEGSAPEEAAESPRFEKMEDG